MASLPVKAAANLSRSATISLLSSAASANLRPSGSSPLGSSWRIRAGAVAHGFFGPPMADGVVIVERQAERVDLAMARRAIGVVAMGFDLRPQRGLGLVRRRRLDGARHSAAAAGADCRRSIPAPTCRDAPGDAACRRRSGPGSTPG